MKVASPVVALERITHAFEIFHKPRKTRTLKPAGCGTPLTILGELQKWYALSVLSRQEKKPNPLRATRRITVRFDKILLLLLLAPLRASGQYLDGNPEHVICVALDSRSDAIYSGIMDKQLSRMGDAAAVAITKVLADKEIDNAAADRVLFILRMAFRAPQIIDNDSDKKPRAALFVLQLVEHQAPTPKQRKLASELKKKLAD